MKVTYYSVIAVLLLVTAAAFAGCASSQPAASSGSAATPAQASGSGAPAAAAATSAASSGSSSASGSQLFGGLSYNWVEYKMTAGETAAEKMTIYYKYNKQTGKCTMRFEGAGAAEMAQAGVSEMDCSSTGSSKGTADPNEASDVQFNKVGTEVVTVPAGTFTADKYVATSKDGMSATYWIASGKPLLKMQGGDSTGSVLMELNGMG